MPTTRPGLLLIALLCTGCAGPLVIYADAERVSLGASGLAKVEDLQPRADQICGEGGKKAVYVSRRQTGTIDGFSYNFRCE